MVLTPFMQILGPLVAEGVGEISVTDNIDDESDGLSVECEVSSATIEQSIDVNVVAGYEEGMMWPLGKYTLQSIEPTSGKERLIFTSAAFTDEMKKKRDESYQKITLDSLIAKMAKRHGLSVKCDMKQRLDHIDQRNESDVALLRRLASKYNAIFNVKNSVLIFLSKRSEQLPHFVVTSQEAKHWHFRQSRKFFYRSVVAKYHDPKQGKQVAVRVGSGKPEYHLEIQCKTKQEAQDIAKAKLEKLAAQCKTGEIELEGRNIIAGGKVVCVGFGKADGEYLITRAVHKVKGIFTSTIYLEQAV